MLDIVIATHNRHKFRELKELLRVGGIRWHSLAKFPHVSSVRETGHTFEANAIRKARAVAGKIGCFALADDSGLEVDALGGLPGIRSARYAGSHGNDRANNDKLLQELEGFSLCRRKARYRCVLALASPKGAVVLTRGQWAGRIALQAAGRQGFGYDPIFIIPRLGKTVGELHKKAKQKLSHRAMAARRIRPKLINLANQSKRSSASVKIAHPRHPAAARNR